MEKSTKKHYILLKEHKDTGLKYLCYHFGNNDSCYSYLGSGVYWKQHLLKHGKKIKTTIIKTCNTQDEARDIGIFYSKQFNIVESKEYANLMIEDARSSFYKNGDPIVKDLNKSARSRKRRRETAGLTQKEIENHKRLGQLDVSVKLTDKWYKSLEKRKDRYNNNIYTEKEKERFKSMAKRKKNKQFTAAEKEGFKTSSIKLKNIPMKERLNNPDYVHPKAKKFILTVNNNDEIFCESVQYLLKQLKLSWSTINALRAGSSHTVKRMRNTKHNFANDDILKLLELS